MKRFPLSDGVFLQPDKAGPPQWSAVSTAGFPLGLGLVPALRSGSKLWTVNERTDSDGISISFWSSRSKQQFLAAGPLTRCLLWPRSSDRNKRFSRSSKRSTRWILRLPRPRWEMFGSSSTAALWFSAAANKNSVQMALWSILKRSSTQEVVC